MQKLLNQRRTMYWLANLCCLLLGSFALTCGLIGWGTVSTIIGGALLLAACLLAVLALRT